jgi:ribosomal protein uL22
MPEYNYTMQLPAKGAEKIARAQLSDVDASFKDLGQVCANIMGKSADKAEALLSKASRGEFPIHYKKHAKKCGHRSEIGGKRGRYPKKSAKIVLGVLKNAVANANAKGLLGDLEVVHASANKLRSFPRVAPRGRWRRNDYVTSRVEIVLEEIAEAKPEVKEKKKKALEAKIADKRKAREEAKKELEEQMKAEEGEEASAAPKSDEEKKVEKALERTSMAQA